MTRTRRRRLILVGLLLIGLGGATALALTAFQQDMMYFYAPTAVNEGKVPSGAHFRVGGIVEKGTVKHSGRGLQVSFRLTDCQSSLLVDYDGLLPDLFREGQGIVAHGRLNNKDVFVADQVLAKHDSKYMPPDVAKTLKKKPGTACMPATDTTS